MNKRNFTIAGAAALLGFALIALPSHSAPQQESSTQRVRILPPGADTEEFTAELGDDGASWLGVETHEVSSGEAKELKLPAEHGAVLGKILPDSPAEKAGLKENDVVTEINGQRVEGTAQFRRIIHEIPSGRSIQ